MSQTGEVTACVNEYLSNVTTDEVFDMSMDSYTETQPVSQPIPIPGSKTRLRVEDSDEEEEATIRPGTNRFKRMKYTVATPMYTEDPEDFKFSEEFLRNADPWWREMDAKFSALIQEIETGVERIDKIYEKVFRKK